MTLLGTMGEDDSVESASSNPRKEHNIVGLQSPTASNNHVAEFCSRTAAILDVETTNSLSVPHAVSLETATNERMRIPRSQHILDIYHVDEAEIVEENRYSENPSTRRNSSIPLAEIVVEYQQNTREKTFFYQSKSFKTYVTLFAVGIVTIFVVSLFPISESERKDKVDVESQCAIESSFNNRSIDIDTYISQLILNETATTEEDLNEACSPRQRAYFTVATEIAAEMKGDIKQISQLSDHVIIERYVLYLIELSILGKIHNESQDDHHYNRFVQYEEDNIENPIEAIYITEMKKVYDGASIPPEINSLTELGTLHITRAGIKGELPSELGLMKKLDIIELPSNKFTGHTPKEIFTKQLRILELSDNLLSGSIPREIAACNESMTVLNLSENNLSGELPSEIGFLSNLANLQLQGNNFSGSVPQELMKLNDVTFLKLHRNNLFGNMTFLCKTIEEENENHEFTSDCTREDVECKCCTKCI